MAHLQGITSAHLKGLGIHNCVPFVVNISFSKSNSSGHLLKWEKHTWEKPLQSSHVHSWKALLTPALVSKELRMSLLKEKNLCRVKSQVRESIPVNSAVRTRLFIHLFHQNPAHSCLPCEAEAYCFKIISLRDVSRQTSRFQPLEDKQFPLVQLFLWAQEGTDFTPLNCSGRINHYNIHFCRVKGIAMQDQHLTDFFSYT